MTHDVSHLTCADFLRSPGTQTPVIVRFSTVIHERGSPETLRDPRGFAVKFYTREGNFDMVGNNMPVFFVRDGMKFPDMVRTWCNSLSGCSHSLRRPARCCALPRSLLLLTCYLPSCALAAVCRDRLPWGRVNFAA